MATIVIYTTSWCPFCTRAKKLLDHKNVTYTDVDVSSPDARAKMVALTGGRTVPQLVINDKPEGGCDELYALERSGKLDKLLSR
ncbi:glutaredoxin 3 [Psychromonas sp. MB-3u-54]|uniref:glutaredoxin 3 n=1 Tax=Psychromonas sp. MB-3u-54 TaxID=2058319 RepID=UPI000C34D8C6|nr:glutaredoxin 3 [Psychromonas sp. MB-3u-54]